MVELATSIEEGHLAELEELNLNSNNITGVGLQALVRAVSKGAMPKLCKVIAWAAARAQCATLHLRCNAHCLGLDARSRL